MGKPGSKSLLKGGEQSGGPEHKAKTAAPKSPLLADADPVPKGGRPLDLGKKMDEAPRLCPGYGSKHPRKD